MTSLVHWNWEMARDDVARYYIFDLRKYSALGRHRPYYEVIRQSIEVIAGLNPSYDPMFDGHYSLEELISDTVSDQLHKLPYIEQSLHLIAVIERAILNTLLYVTELEEYLIICVDARIIDDLLIIGLGKWI